MGENSVKAGNLCITGTPTALPAKKFITEMHKILVFT
jgi:hypothetical protein